MLTAIEERPRHVIIAWNIDKRTENASGRRISCADEIFQLTEKTVKDPGFTEVMTWLNVDDDQKVPVLSRGDQLTLRESGLHAGETSPPGYLTESELITLMEKHGIGTDASIPVHINTISQRNYVTVESGRRLVPTQLGISLVHGYWRVDRELVLPTMRAEVETQLNPHRSRKS
ncbi:hypothetical protein COOONC_02841 [Cooperia oncophora]